MNSDIYQFSVTKNNGEQIELGEYKGKVLLIVNTASKCGFTPQYEGLQKLYDQYRDQGFEILAFPCDQFGHQEPGSDSDIAQFCSMNFNTQFPLFKKIEVNGNNADPLYNHLKKQAPGIIGTKGIKWNFTKFLINRDGKVIKRFAPTVKPEQLKNEIESLL
ncbi:glutathione peroxidase [Neptunicella marina]|uniref:Glutathione peroxidase n=1 Tax=Neptunicella marina TaxID=2125989 RepID=A0A8J6IXL0_9ALTE|nr:glutathione peroxidase [Neptunicella marina]MBC3767325.1 glutathione peroxidase [Neptunicella marina]